MYIALIIMVLLSFFHCAFFGHHPAPNVAGSLCYMARYRSALRFTSVFLPLVVTISQR